MRHLSLAVIAMLSTTAAADSNAFTSPTTPQPPGLEPRPQPAPRSGTIALGIGESYATGFMSAGIVQQFAFGFRFQERDWATVTFGRAHGFLEEAYSEAYLWEGTMSLGRMLCGGGSALCFAFSAGAGYQHAGYTIYDDINFDDPMDYVTDRDNLFGEGRMAARLNLNYVWLETSLAMRAHVAFDSESAGKRVAAGTVFGLALYITP